MMDGMYLAMKQINLHRINKMTNKTRLQEKWNSQYVLVHELRAAVDVLLHAAQKSERLAEALEIIRDAGKNAPVNNLIYEAKQALADFVEGK
jgi:hypothetical protein